ncbi:MAG: hypothetical protein J6S80_00345 [Alphaproteobacteria bacterium]|nr:hypothetical protein [Alphaproteobacteria bacterium]
MKKFLVFFVFLFGLACSAMAADWPRDMQEVSFTDCTRVWKGDGSVEYAVYFDTDDVNVNAECVSDYNRIKSELEREASNIGSIEIFGSADCQKRGVNSQYNVELSKKRAQWAINNIIPDSFKPHCKGGKHTEKCQVYAMGESNDSAYSEDDCKNNPNQAARAVYVNVIWRSQTCKDMAADKVESIKKELEKEDLVNWEIAAKLNVDEKVRDIITNATGVIDKMQRICGKSDNTQLNPSQVGQYNNLYGELSGFLVKLLKLNAELPEPVIVGGGQLEVYVDTYFNLTIDIDKIYARLLKLQESLDVSVWRNAEGKFNTARLASDSIAGVVLGTVGGIVTSKLVKKNQLKKGFEDLSCHVGGQRVADYGDSFRMGLEN